MLKKNEKYRIIIIDDDSTFSHVLQLALKREGYEVFIIDNVDDAYNHLTHADQVSLFIVDYDLGDKSANGRDFCRAIKAKVGKPIVMLSGDSSPETKVSCLYAGADYYVNKPYNLSELLAEIHVVLRQNTAASTLAKPQSTLQGLGLKFSLNSKSLSYQGKAVRLSDREAEVAEFLLGNYGKDVRRETIFYALFGKEMHPLNRAVDILVTRLRKKLRFISDEFFILPSTRGHYRLVKEEELSEKCA